MNKFFAILALVFGLIILLFGFLGLYFEIQKIIHGNPDDAILIALLFIGIGFLSLWFSYRYFKNAGKTTEPESIQTKSRKSYIGAIEKKTSRPLTPIVLDSTEKISNIFLSYRRSDSANVTGRIYDSLLRDFDKKQIFKDVDSIPLGVDFRKHLNQKVGECNVLIAVIGNQWIEPNTPKGQKRIDDKKDFVRVEIEAALERNIPVIPVLVREAQMPAADELPESMTELAYRNGIPVRPDPDFHKDMERLIQGIKHHI